MGNPAKIMFNSEEELLVCLGIQEPDVTATMVPMESIGATVLDSPARTVSENKHRSVLRKPSFNVKTHLHHQPGTVIVLIPIGLPGMGKSVFVEGQLRSSLEKSYPNHSLHVISNDDLRKEIVAQYRQSHKKASNDEAITETNSKVSEAFRQNLIKVVDEGKA